MLAIWSYELVKFIKKNIYGVYKNAKINTWQSIKTHDICSMGGRKAPAPTPSPLPSPLK